VTHPFLARCELWLHLADALSTHPDRDALCDAINTVEGLCREAQAQAIAAAHAEGLADGAAERDRLRAELTDKEQQLFRLIDATYLVTLDEHGNPPPMPEGTKADRSTH
jgi:hypothetical protein